MSKLDRQLEEDRHLRDSARSVFRKEVEFARQEYSPSAISQRIAGKVGSKLTEVGEQTAGFARRNGPKAVMAAVAAAGAAGLWMIRKPIISGLAALADRCKESLQGAEHEVSERGY